MKHCSCSLLSVLNEAWYQAEHVYLCMCQAGYTVQALVSWQNVTDRNVGYIRYSVTFSVVLTIKAGSAWPVHVLSLKGVSPGEGNKQSSRKQIDIHLHKACCESRASAVKVTVCIEYGREQSTVAEITKECNKTRQRRTESAHRGDHALTVCEAD